MTKPAAMYKIDQMQFIPISLEAAWDFYSNPKNLATVTPDNLGFQIKSELPDTMYPGMLIEYTVKPLLGIPLTWVTEITNVKEHVYFTDHQLKGPYATWHHQHFFKAVSGGTEVRDLVHYQLPLEPFSRIVHPFLVQPKLNEIFAYREAKMQELFGRTAPTPTVG